MSGFWGGGIVQKNSIFFRKFADAIIKVSTVKIRRQNPRGLNLAQYRKNNSVLIQTFGVILIVDLVGKPFSFTGFYWTLVYRIIGRIAYPVTLTQATIVRFCAMFHCYNVYALGRRFSMFICIYDHLYQYSVYFPKFGKYHIVLVCFSLECNNIHNFYWSLSRRT